MQRIEISLNIDGLPIFKSRKLSVWPIQGVVSNIPCYSNIPFIIALFCGTCKPSDLNFLSDLVREIKELIQHGLNGMQFNVKHVICDAPARAMVKGTKQYNGQYGCDICDVKGQYDGFMLFLTKGNVRTDTSFREKHNPQHHKSDSPFLAVNSLNMINSFPIDPMHCVDLGVTKRLLLLWESGPIPYRLSSNQIQQISSYLMAIRRYFPSIVNRKPRGLEELRMWKATEFRTFLLYAGIVALRPYLNKPNYIHFLSLSVAIRILYSKKLFDQHSSFAEQLLTYFVDKSIDIYGQKFVSYNVHCLSHLCHFAKLNENVQDCSAYKFENNMTRLKRYVRGTGSPIIQIANRLAEHCSLQNPTKKCAKTIAVGQCFVLSEAKFAIIQTVLSDSAICEVHNLTEALFNEPCDSRILGIFKGYQQRSDMKKIIKADLSRPALALPTSVSDSEKFNELAFIPIVHSF